MVSLTETHLEDRRHKVNHSERTIMRKQQKILGWLCILLPVLSIGFGTIGWLRGVNYPGWYESISATYYANSRMIMIGLLCACGIYFWAYKGYDKADSITTSIAAIAAFGIVMFPCSDGRSTTETIVGLFSLPTHISGIFHCTFATALYATFIVQTCLFRKSKGEKTPKKIIRNRIYLACLIFMGIGAAFILSCCFIPVLIPCHYFVLIGESFFQIGYGVAWLVKAELISGLSDD